MRSMFLALFLAAASMASHAQTKTFNDWRIEVVDANTIAAYTMNDSGGLFGKICYVDAQQCLWVLTSSAPCETDGNYAVLSNSKAGANMHGLTCLPHRQLGQQLMRFDSFEEVSSIAQQSGQVGFAFPIMDGQFRVLRFSLTGSTLATDQLNELVIAAGKASTKDLSL